MGGEKHELRRHVRLRAPSSPVRPIVGEELRMSSSVFVHIIDDDQAVRESLRDLLRSMDYRVALYASAAEFLNVDLPDAPACLVLDVRLPGTGGLELQEYLTHVNIRLPVIFDDRVWRHSHVRKGHEGGSGRLPHEADTGSGSA